MGYWKEWGAYIACCMESGTSYGSNKLNWDRVESDWLVDSVGTGRLYGGGVGCIQITSRNWEFLKECYDTGSTLGGLTGTILGNDLTAGKPSRNYAVGSTSNAQGGVFTAGEVPPLRAFLRQANSINVQSKYQAYYFNTTNKHVIDSINSMSSAPDSVKAFLTRICVLSPACALTTSKPTYPKTTQECINQCVANGLGSYLQMLQELKVLCDKTDFSKEPPVNIFTLSTSEGIDETDVSGDSVVDDSIKPVAEFKDVKLGKDPLYLKNNELVQFKSNVKFDRYNDFLFFRGLDKNDSSNFDNNIDVGNVGGVDNGFLEDIGDFTNTTKWDDFAFLNSLCGKYVDGYGGRFPNYRDNTQCYQLAKEWLKHYGYPDLISPNGNGTIGKNSGTSNASAASDIYNDFDWGGAKFPDTIGKEIYKYSDVQSGDIVCTAGSSIWGHVVIAHKVYDNDFSFYDQNYLNQAVTLRPSYRKALGNFQLYGIVRSVK